MILVVRIDIVVPAIVTEAVAPAPDSAVGLQAKTGAVATGGNVHHVADAHVLDRVIIVATIMVAVRVGIARNVAGVAGVTPAPNGAVRLQSHGPVAAGNHLGRGDIGLIGHHIVRLYRLGSGDDMDIVEALDIQFSIQQAQCTVTEGTLVSIGSRHGTDLRPGTVVVDHPNSKQVRVGGQLTAHQISHIALNVIHAAIGVSQVEAVIHPGDHIVQTDPHVLVPVHVQAESQRIVLLTGGQSVDLTLHNIPLHRIGLALLIKISRSELQSIGIPVTHLIRQMVQGVTVPAKDHTGILYRHGIAVREGKIDSTVKVTIVVAVRSQRGIVVGSSLQHPDRQGTVSISAIAQLIVIVGAPQV